MKNIIYIAIAGLFLLASCQDKTEIEFVPQGEDVTAPVVTIGYPSDGQLIRVKEDVTSLNIELKVVDDIELNEIIVSLDGTELTVFNSFKDYRVVIEEYLYETLGNGAHNLTVVASDLSGKSTTFQVSFEKVEPYQTIFDGEKFYMPFDGDYMELINIIDGTQVGAPSFDEVGKLGKAYKGAEDAYLTIPTTGILNPEISATFWYNPNGDPDRAGILVVGPVDADNEADKQNNRKSGFRLFREGTAEKQRIKLNVGNGEGDAWNDGGEFDIDGSWVHIAFTISATNSVIYINGEAATTADITGVNWDGCDILSIMSGSPRFNGWGHKSDASVMDELRFYNKALTEAEVKATME